jgi:hypothetical protein
MSTTQLNSDDKLMRGAQRYWPMICRQDLTAWTIAALAPFKQTPAKHHRLLLRHLEALAKGEIDRLMVLCPPGSAKSTYCSVLFPAWFLAQKNYLDVIGVSHSASLAEKFSGRTQQQIRDHEAILGYGLANESVEEWRTTNGGMYRAAGVGGSITGRRADLAIIDDPVKDAADAESIVERENTWEWYKQVLYTRLKPGGRICVIQTRWHPEDLSGHLLQAMETGGDRWTVLKLPALCDSLTDPLGRALGEALWPEWQDIEALKRIRENTDEFTWGSLYQQDPRPRGASFFNIDDLLVDGEAPPLPVRCDTVFAEIDTAIKSGQEHNSTAVTWYSYNSLVKPSTYILDWDIIQIEGAAQEAWLSTVFTRGEELARTCGARKGFAGALIEDKATGTVLIQQAKNKKLPAYAIDSKLTAMGKEERAIAASPYVIGGDVKLSEPAFNKTKIHKGRSANHLVLQITNFRLGSAEKDGLDLLDTFCYGVLATRGTASGPRKGI